MTTMVCRGCQLEKKFAEAHIVPRGFARQLMSDQKHNMKISMDGVGVTHHGVYDKKILCQDCDNKLGLYDDYALDVCRRFPKEHSVAPDGIFEMKNVDGNKLSAFILALLWRASISSRPEFRKVSLGPFEDQAHAVLFRDACLADLQGYELIMGRFFNAPINPMNFYTSPAKAKMDDRNAWHFSLSGFKIFAKMDQRQLPQILKPIIVNGNDVLRGQFLDYRASAEHHAFKAMLLAQRKHVMPAYDRV